MSAPSPIVLVVCSCRNREIFPNEMNSSMWKWVNTWWVQKKKNFTVTRLHKTCKHYQWLWRTVMKFIICILCNTYVIFQCPSRKCWKVYHWKISGWVCYKSGRKVQKSYSPPWIQRAWSTCSTQKCWTTPFRDTWWWFHKSSMCRLLMLKE